MSINEVAESAYARTINLIFSGASLVDGLDDLAAYLDAIVPHATWASLRDIARQTPRAAFTTWLGEQLARHPADVDILWFSLADTGDEITLCLLRQKRVPRDDHDWAAYEQVIAIDLPQEILRPLDDLAQVGWADSGATDRTRWIVETCVPLAWASLLVGVAVRELPATTLLGNDNLRRVAVFFGEGDDFFLGEIRSGGFQFAVPPTSGNA